MDCMRNQFNNGILLHNRYRSVCPLNHGSFGLVFKAEDVVTGQPVALKCITKSSAASPVSLIYATDDKSEELAVHRRIGYHPNIVNLIDSFETENHVYLVIEYCPNGDLYEAIRVGRGPGQTENIRDALLQLIDAVLCMHAKGVYHRDIKPENILLSSDGTIKLGDFGLATLEDVSVEAAVGSDRYMAPEQMQPPNTGYAPRQVDAWAIGICLLNILFSRNPFATPTLSDPLFSDFAADRQTLFDIFPNMSQDTFDILVHCLALEPEYRSLELARDAVLRAVSFTTDDETLDEFCAAPAVTATANREPLRTPSLASPQNDSTSAFQWAKALATTVPVQPLSVIHDVDYQDDYRFVQKQAFSPASQADNKSLVSFVDSGLGLSVKSSNHSLNPDTTIRSKPVPISGSLPATAAKPMFRSMASIFGRGDQQSKSWSDLYDEDSEFENAMQARDNDQDDDFFTRRASSHDTLDSLSNGSDTPRVPLSELKNPENIHNSRVQTPDTERHVVSEHTGFLFEEHNDDVVDKTPTPMPSLVHRHSSSPKRSGLDRWAALGDRRRQPTSRKGANSTFVMASKRPRNDINSRKNAAFNIWVAGQRNWNVSTGSLSTVDNNNNNKKQWNMSKDWRKHDACVAPTHTTITRGRPLEWVWRM